ncbi:MAG: OmpA family protein [Planctomycetes bacterium]|nr:OmpA family protein [Planctomycetota bacterium]
MAKKHKCPEGVPEWIVTYGDMMSLLLCFFILLAAFSEPKKDKEYQEVVQAIQEAFGYTGGSGFIPSIESPATSILKRIDAINLHRDIHARISRADDPGVTGKEATVKKVREGLQFTVGGQIAFEAGSATLTDAAKVEIGKIAAVIRGQNNKIEIRGHCSNDDLVANSGYADLWQLSAARASAVMHFLTSPEEGIDPRRLRVVACANYEPIAQRVYDPSKVAVNRRVEILATENLISDFEDNPGPSSAAPIDNSR